MLLITLGLVLFVSLVVVHEWGHLYAAKKNGVEVEEFGIGFPPRAKILTKKNGTEYTLNWLPLGGFVKLKGEHASAKGKGTFGAASFGKKSLIILAGILMNWVAAAVIFTVVAIIGMPQLIEGQFKVRSDAKVIKQQVVVAEVENGSPAEMLGLKQLDVIKSIAGQPVTTSQQLRDVTKINRGKDVEIEYQRGDKTQTASTKLRTDIKEGALGVSPGDNTVVRSTWSAPIVGVATTAQLTGQTYKGIYQALSNLFSGQARKASDSVTGPIGIFITLKLLAQQGIAFVLFLIAVISLSLAVFNSLPIPALDGGRLFVMGLFKLLKKPLSKELEEKIHGTGMILLLLLALIITVNDIGRL
jgi:regulator of sigma E protease